MADGKTLNQAINNSALEQMSYKVGEVVEQEVGELIEGRLHQPSNEEHLPGFCTCTT
jgi:hypothetical protein